MWSAFEYARASSLAEASELLAADPEGVRVLAGGTDLLVFLFDRKWRPKLVLDVKGLTELRGIEPNGGLRIGALTTMRELETDPHLAARYAGVRQGAGEVGSVQIRCRATIGGNLGTASPAADGVPALLAHGASVELHLGSARRTVPLAELFAGPGRTILQPGELIGAVQLPAVGERSGSCYLKLASRAAMDLAFVGVGGYVSLDSDGRVADAAVGLGAVAPTPLRLPLSDLLRSRPLDDEALAAAGEAAMAACSPISDQRCSADYRRAMVGVLTRRALRQAAAKAGSSR